MFGNSRAVGNEGVHPGLLTEKSLMSWYRSLTRMLFCDQMVLPFVREGCLELTLGNGDLPTRTLRATVSARGQAQVRRNLTNK